MTTLPLRARMSWPARLIASMMGLLVMWLVVRNAALELLSEREPTAAMGFLPAGSGALAADGWSRVATSGGRVDPVARRRAAEALRREPVNASALTLIGLAASADGRLDQARLLMEAARDRDPRLPAARYWLLDHDMRSGDYAAGLKIQDRLVPLHDAIFKEPGVAGAKHGLKLLGRLEEEVRPPLMPVTPLVGRAIRDAMVHAGVLN